MNNQDVFFKIGANETGENYGDIQVSGNLRKILCLLLHVFSHNDFNILNSHHGNIINLIDYPFRMKFGSFGNDKKYIN